MNVSANFISVNLCNCSFFAASSSLIYWIIPVVTILLVMAALLFNKYYQSYKKGDFRFVPEVELPPGLKCDYNPSEKPNDWLTRPINKRVALPSIPSRLPLKLAETVGAQKKSENSDAIEQYQALELKENPSQAENEEQSKPYIQIGLNNDVEDEISHPYVQSGDIPDLLQVPHEAENELPSYVAFRGNVNDLPAPVENNIPCSYVVAGKNPIFHPYVPFHDSPESEIEDNSSYITAAAVQNDSKPYVPLATLEQHDSSEKKEVFNETALKPQKNHQYIPLQQLEDTLKEKVPLLQLPGSSHSHNEFSRPYVAVGDLVRDTPA